MIRRISVQDLQVGMYVVHPGLGRELDPHIYSLEGFILSAEQLDMIAKQGFTGADIDDERTQQGKPRVQITAAPVPVAPLKPIVPFAAEMEKAHVVCENALAAARELHARLGRCKVSNAPMLYAEKTRPLFENIATSLVHNRNVLQALSNLRTDDQYTYTHCLNVGLYTALLGHALGVAQENLPDLVMAGFFHDIGKIFIPGEIIKFPGKLNAVQYATVQRHPELGYEYLRKQPDLSEMVLLAARDHHERQDGRGYPAGRKGDAISFIGSIVAVADVYDALSSERSYKAALPSSISLGMMYKQRKECFHAEFLEQFIRVVGVYPPGSLVQLSNGQCGVVMECNDENLLRPKIILLTSPEGEMLPRIGITDLETMPELEIKEAIGSIPGQSNVQAVIRQVCAEQQARS